METYFDKPIGTQISILSNSVTQLTEGVNNTQDGLAIVANGNTHAAISSGQFVYVKSHDTLSEGLYKATVSISANEALTSSNLTPDGSGGLNALKSDIDTLNSKIETVSESLAYSFNQNSSDPNLRINKIGMEWNTTWNTWGLVVSFGGGTAHIKIDTKN